MAHGTPDSLDDMREYLRIVRGGREPSDALVDEMTRNYQAIGGRSPLTAITLQQAAALQARLGPAIRVLVGMRNWHPFISDVLGSVRDDGLTSVLGVPLAPQCSSLSVRKYVEAAAAAMPAGVPFDYIESFHDHPLLIAAFAARVREAGPIAPDEAVIFTAHSLPERVVAEGDPYPDEVTKTAAAVAAACGIDRYHLAFQSAGRTPEPWLRPDVSAVIRERAAAGARRMLVVPIGFVCDHTEILFDIDVQAAATARACGAILRRPASLNVSPLFIDMLASLVHTRLATVDDAQSRLDGARGGF